MPRFGTEIEHPGAYYAAVDARIKANSSLTRRRKLEAEIANDSPEFRAWLLGTEPEHIAALREAAQRQYDLDYDQNSPEQKALDQAWKDWYAKVGHVPGFLIDALRDWGGLTEKQLAFARRAFAENIAKGEQRNAAEQPSAPTRTTRPRLSYDLQ